jgi:carbon-monoxide dehydrogenase small subunit
VPAEDLFDSAYETTLEPEELIVAIRIPVRADGEGFAIREVTRRMGDFALAGCATKIALDGAGSVTSARVALFGVAGRPVRLAVAEEALVGTRNGGLDLASVLEEATSGLEPLQDASATSEYRKKVARHIGTRVNEREVTLTVNGQTVSARAEARKTLADFLREDCLLTGTHVGCEQGVCGACTVMVDGSAVRSCLMFAVQADGAEVTTIEGLASNGSLTAVQQAFRDNHGLQCGFCTPGFIVSIEAFLRDNPAPSEAEIREGLSGNVCRCTGYQGIIAAVRQAAEQMQKETI